MEINMRPSDSAGPARVPHQIRQLTIKIEVLEVGLRISTPTARGWARVARNTAEVGHAINAAFTEAQVAAYARAHNQRYDLDALTAAVEGDPMAPPRAAMPRRRRPSTGTGWGRGQVRPDTHTPDSWVPGADGSWISPAGRTYRAGSQTALRVEARLRAAGMLHDQLHPPQAS